MNHASCTSVAITQTAMVMKWRRGSSGLKATMARSSNVISVALICSLKRAASENTLGAVSRVVPIPVSYCAMAKSRRPKWIRFPCLNCAVSRLRTITYCEMALLAFSWRRASFQSIEKPGRPSLMSCSPIRPRSTPNIIICSTRHELTIRETVLRFAIAARRKNNTS